MADAVIALANLMTREGVLNEESTSRLTLASELVLSGAAPVLVTCGWAYRSDSDLVIADVMAAYAAAELGLSPARIMTEVNSRDTVGDAVFTKLKFANPLGWGNLIVVTSDYHVRRTEEIFSFVYGRRIEVRGAPTPEPAQRQAGEEASIQTFRSTFDGISPGDDAAIYDRMRSRHPFYSGEVYSRLGSWPMAPVQG